MHPKTCQKLGGNPFCVESRGSKSYSTLIIDVKRYNQQLYSARRLSVRSYFIDMNKEQNSWKRATLPQQVEYWELIWEILVAWKRI